MCNKFDFVRFLANISNKFSIIKYNFWCFVFNFCEINEQIVDAIFVHIDIDFDVKIEKRESFDTMIEREIVSIQNIDFFDVTKFVKIDYFDVTIDVANEIKKNKLSMIDFEWLTNNVNINVDSFVDVNVAKNVDVSIIVIVTNSIFNIEKNDRIAISFDIIIANSFANFNFDFLT